MESAKTLDLCGAGFEPKDSSGRNRSLLEEQSACLRPQTCVLSPFRQRQEPGLACLSIQRVIMNKAGDGECGSKELV